MRLELNRFVKVNGLRRPSEFTSGRIRNFASISMPKGSVVHYWPDQLSVAGPSNQEPFLSEVATSFIDHVTTLNVREGRPIPSGLQVTTILTNYRREHRRYKALVRDRALTANKLNMLVVNYAPLNLLYRYTPTVKTEYYRWYNQANTFITKVNDLAKRMPGWGQFLTIEIPETTPTRQQLISLKNMVTKQTLETVQGNSGFFIFELWKFLQHEDSIFHDLSDEAAKSLFLIFKNENQFSLFSIAQFKQWMSTKDLETGKTKVAQLTPERAPLLFLSYLDHLRVENDEEEDEERSTIAPVASQKSSSLDLDGLFEEDLEVSTSPKSEPQEPDEPEIAAALEEVRKDPLVASIERSAADMLKNKLISKTTYARAIEDALTFKSIEDPWGSDLTLDEIRNVTPEELQIPDRKFIEQHPTIFDPSFTESTVLSVQRKYVKEVLPKDIVSSVLSIQKQNVAIKDYKIERKEDAVNAYEVHRVTVKPVRGRKSVLEFRVPIFDEQNKFISNGNKQVMRLQRIDLPIRKVKPNRVVCSSYYGKIFIERVERKVSNYGSWIADTIKKRGFNTEDTSIRDLELNAVFTQTVNLPFAYTAIAKEIGRFTTDIQGSAFTFELDYLRRDSLFSEKALEYDTESSRIIAHNATSALYIDPQDVLQYVDLTQSNPKYVPIGRLVEVLGLPEQEAPVPAIEMKILDKVIPVGLALAYQLGLKKLVKLLECNVRKVSRGEKAVLAPHEYRLTFDNESWVLSRKDRRATLVLGGFERRNKLLRQYSSEDFENNDVYYRILEEAKLSSRYLRELENIYAAWMDHITEEILQSMGEPTTVEGLLVRAAEMLMTEDSPPVTAPKQMRYRGPERVAGIIYQELNRAVKTFNNRNGADGTISINPISIWQKIVQDPAVLLVEEANPIQCLREQEGMTYRGFGGRPDRAMTAESRIFDEGDRGVVSESTVDSGAVGVVNFLSPNANFDSVRGLTRVFDSDSDGNSSLFSTSMLLAPLADHDDRCLNTRSTYLVMSKLCAL